jgi:hypothetical protein
MPPAMGPSSSSRAITRERYDALLFDLDGVITDTASLHAKCWKQMFDDYLQTRATQRGEVFRPFDIATDTLLVNLVREMPRSFNHHGAHLVVNDLAELVD